MQRLKLTALLTLVSLLNLWGCQKSLDNPFTPDDFANAEPIKAYLAKEIAFTSFDGQAFCAYDIIAGEVIKRKVELYIWALCHEYYQSEGQLKKGGALIVPLSLSLNNTENGFNIVGHRQPRDGGLYLEDVLDIFPASVQVKS